MLCRPVLLSHLIPLIMLAATTAEAGTLSSNGWAPTGCGAEPVAAKLDLSNLDAYNVSVGVVNTYRKNSRIYVDCLIKEANSDIQSVTKAAKAAQQAVHDSDDKIFEDEKSAAKLFPK